MATFPTTPKPQFEYVEEQEFKTIISIFDDGNEQRRAKWAVPRYNVSLTYNALPASHSLTLWEFYKARKGAWESFYFFAGEAEADSRSYQKEYICVSNGSDTVLDLPCRLSTVTALYKNSSVMSTADYTVNTTAGANGEDTLSLASAPASGDVLTCDFDGYLKIKCRFEDDRMSRTLFDRSLYRTGLQLKGLPAAT